MARKKILKLKLKNPHAFLYSELTPYNITVILLCCFDYENVNLLTTTFKVIKYCSKNKQKKCSKSDTH